MDTDLRTLVMQGNFHLAAEQFAATKHHTPQDERFAGLALFNLGLHKDARQILLQSIARGHVEAKIELACLLRHAGDFRVAATLLDSLDFTLLQTFDRCLYLFERSAINSEAGRRDDAGDALEQAWLLSFETSEGKALQPGIAQALGAFYTESGFDNRSADHFDFAVRYGSPDRQTNARLARARALVYAGRDDDARTELQQVQRQLGNQPNLGPLYAYNLGILERFCGALEAAITAFQQAAQQARHLNHTNTEAYAELALSALHLERGAPDLARRHLAVVRKHRQTDRIRSYFLLREGALLNAQDDPGARATLEEAVQGFEKSGLYRETAWAALHLADAYGRAGDLDGQLRALSVVTDQRHIIGNGAMLKAELRALPAIQRVLEDLPVGHYVHVLLDDFHQPKVLAPQQVLVLSMGDASVLLDGQPARFELARTAEVLVYLLCHPPQTLNTIVTQLFPDSDVKLAKNYFHQVRYDLARSVPGLNVPFDRATRTYGLQTGSVILKWDTQLIQSAGTSPDAFLASTCYLRGPFLARIDTEWTDSQRHRIHWQIMRVGLSILEYSFANQVTPECEQVIERLLMLEPFSETLALYQVRCARLMHGRTHAAAHLNTLIRRFEEEFGNAPDELLRERVRQPSIS